MDNILLKDVPIEMFDNKKILITGASGLIGTHFLYAFRNMYDKKVKVTVTAIGRHYPPGHLVELLRMPFVQYLPYNLTCESLSSFHGFDFIIHAASYGQPRKFTKYATETVKLNTSILIDLLEKIKPNGKFLFISSSEVCNGLYNLPIAEDMIGTTTPYHPRACYIEAKRCGEAIVNVFRNDGIDAKSVRLCLAYGEGTREDDQRVLNVFIKKALVNREIELMDAGQSIRKYCYVKDAVNMMLRVLLEGKHPVYNIGGKLSLNIAQLASMIGDIVGVPVLLKLKGESLDGSPEVVNMSMQRYFDEFGSRDFVSMEEGLKRTINYQRELYGITTNEG
jgi:UDP-glucuronate decarboxylase